MSRQVLEQRGVAKTLLQSLVHERHLTREQLIEVLDRRARSLDIQDFALSLRQVDRWFSGRVATLPRPSVCRVLEAEFGYPVAELLGPDTRPGRNIRGTPGSSHMTASQEAWRSVRRYLNGHRAQLAKLAESLYEPEMVVPGTSLLTHPDWMPAEPALLEDVTLRWENRSQVTIEGTEPEARAQLPRGPRSTFTTGTRLRSRYLEAPSLFENRPSYRLLQIDWDHPRRGSLVFGPAAYFDKLDICETLGHEFAAAALKDAGHPVDIGWRHLPFRRVVGDPFDLTCRAVIPAITTLTLIRGSDGGARFLMHWRDPTKVADGRWPVRRGAGRRVPARQRQHLRHPE